jgi:hypothetical protein
VRAAAIGRYGSSRCAFFHSSTDNAATTATGTSHIGHSSAAEKFHSGA